MFGSPSDARRAREFLSLAIARKSPANPMGIIAQVEGSGIAGWETIQTKLPPPPAPPPRALVKARAAWSPTHSPISSSSPRLRRHAHYGNKGGSAGVEDHVPRCKAFPQGDRPRLPASPLDPAPTDSADRHCAFGAAMAPRNQVGRLPHGCARRSRTGTTVDSNWARLDREISERGCRVGEGPGKSGLL